MKAFVRHKYGSPDVLKLEEIPEPTPLAHQVLVKVAAVALNAFDWRMLRAKPFLVRFMGGGIFKPKVQVLGADLAGRVEMVGSAVTRFKPGDEVFGAGSRGGGGLAEYAVAREDCLVKKPASASFEEVAALPMAGLTALQGLRDKGKIESGQQVLIHGAAGGVGTYAVQLAKVLEAEVTAVCSSRNVEQALALGADHVIDYTKEDFAKSDRRYDLVFVANGSRSVFDYIRAAKVGGRCVLAGGSTSQLISSLLLAPPAAKLRKKRFTGYVANINKKDLSLLSELMESGRIKPVIDKRFSFDEVQEAFRYIETGHARGKVVITL